jgi:hypothetical protein
MNNSIATAKSCNLQHSQSQFQAFRKAEQSLTEIHGQLGTALQLLRTSLNSDFHQVDQVQGNCSTHRTDVPECVKLLSFPQDAIDIERVIEQKIVQHRLCIIDGRGRRELYWDGTFIEIPWHKRKRAWTLLTALAEEASRSQQGIDECNDLGISLRDARHDLSKLLPADLFSFIAIENKVHRLTLPLTDFYLGRLQSNDTLDDISVLRGDNE